MLQLASSEKSRFYQSSSSYVTLSRCVAYELARAHGACGIRAAWCRLGVSSDDWLEAHDTSISSKDWLERTPDVPDDLQHLLHRLRDEVQCTSEVVSS